MKSVLNAAIIAGFAFTFAAPALAGDAPVNKGTKSYQKMERTATAPSKPADTYTAMSAEDASGIAPAAGEDLQMETKDENRLREQMRLPRKH